MITAPLPRASPLGSGRLSMIIPQNHGLTITCIMLSIQLNQDIESDTFPGKITKFFMKNSSLHECWLQ